MGRGNLIVGQSGGPTSVINASLAGIVRTAAGERRVDRVLGMRYGIEGLMAGNLVDLGKESASTVEGLIRRPSSALGSCRLKLKDEHLPRIFEIIKANDIRCMLLIGGNDTMDTIRRISEYARERGYDFAGVGVPKTVDNDLYGTDHTPGFASAARYTALSVQQAGILARDMRMVDQYVVFQAIGRDAGWLAAAAALSRQERGDAPHILVLQERAFDKDAFLGKVESVYKDHGFVSIVCGEGCKHADGTPVSASRIMDKFGNIEFGAMGGTGVALVLHRMIAETFGFRGEFQITESLSMCAADRAVPRDAEEAYLCGRTAVELALSGAGGVMVTLVRRPGGGTCTTGTIGLSEVAGRAKPIPDEFINADGMDITPAFLEYAAPLVGELPNYENLSYHPYRP